ncbi:helix-turn-helix transcriptional regulator [Streptomyces prasinosporus]|uniref:helix-turn-helix domain-containing protein n=1 Tax=Streptomyces prasinosporus TaxID=68256 RepID=UPI0031E5B64D
MSAQDDVARFAALLRELKERTDRSYGSLARRVHMNTSTLHRYCAGEAVPVDFAPVERFAALCGASGEERLELHRRWLRAVAARQRPRPAGAAGGGATTGPGPADRTTTAPDAPDAPDIPDGPDGPDGPARAGGGAGEAGHGGAPVAEGDVVSGARADDARGRPWYRRRRVAAALAAACALLATVGSLSALPDDGRRPSAGGGPTAAPAVSAPAAPAAPRARASSPAPSGSAAPGGSPSPTAAPREPSAPAAGSAAPADSAPAGPPLTWTADSQAWAHGCGHDYVIAKPPRQVPPPPAPQDAGTWAATQSAVHGGETIVALSVQGTSDTAVVLTALRVRVAGRGEPAPGNAYAMDQGCGGALTPRYFDVDLDMDRPVARAVAGNDAGTPVPAVRLPYRVSATDPEVLLVTARTGTCDCRWYLELDWSSRGRTGTVRVDDHGRPFRTSGIEGLPRYEYDTSARRWSPRAP